MSNWKQQLEVRQSLAIAKSRWQGPPKPDREGSVYIIRIGSVYKIGKSYDAELRIKSMQLPQAPDEVKVFRCKNNKVSLELEAALHKCFKRQRKHGEWFELNHEQYLNAQLICAEWVTE